jgi:hypothetical protein
MDTIFGRIIRRDQCGEKRRQGGAGIAADCKSLGQQAHGAGDISYVRMGDD